MLVLFLFIGLLYESIFTHKNQRIEVLWLSIYCQCFYTLKWYNQLTKILLYWLYIHTITIKYYQNSFGMICNWILNIFVCVFQFRVIWLLSVITIRFHDQYTKILMHRFIYFKPWYALIIFYITVEKCIIHLEVNEKNIN